MWNIAICDDELIVQQQILQILEQCAGEKQQIFCFPNGEELLKAADTITFDLIYLDMQMTGMNGMETARFLRQRGCDVAIIILTNYDDYLAAGYEVEAFRYRFKPVDEFFFKKDYQAWQKWLAENRVPPVLITTEDGVHQFQRNDIISMEVTGRKVKVITTSGVYLAKESMHQWEQSLSGFLEPYNKILVNPQHVKFFDTVKVITTGDYQLPMSRRKYQKFRADMMK
ncbi:MAG: response regulator transcription factor [Peptococcaceae bacterium]|nr:response regulator transcription factor [Peptococcaceae bacterium]